MTRNGYSELKKTIIGSICVATGTLLFAINTTIFKYSGMKESQLLFGRFSTQLFIAFLYWRFNKPSNVTNWYGDSPYIKYIWARSVAYSSLMLFEYYAVIVLPLGDTIAIFYQAPVFTAILAAIFLKEKLPKLVPLTCLLGITGTIFIAQPTWLVSLINSSNYESLNVSGIFAIICAMFSWSIACLMVRSAKTVHFIQLEIANSMLLDFVGVPLLMILNTLWIKSDVIGELDTWNSWTFNLENILIMISMGIIGFCALSFNVIGFQYGDATKVAWIEYLQIILAFIIQSTIFNDTPNWYEITGGILILTAAFLAIFEELYKHYFVNNEEDEYQLIPENDELDVNIDI